MTGQDLWNTILFALVCTPAEVPEKPPCPPEALAAVQRLAVYGGMCHCSERWEGWPVARSVPYLRQHFHVLGYPPGCELDRFPPREYAEFACAQLDRLCESLEFSVYACPHQRDHFLRLRETTHTLRDAWGLILQAHASRGRDRRATLAELRQRHPYYYRLPGTLPLTP